MSKITTKLTAETGIICDNKNIEGERGKVLKLPRKREITCIPKQKDNYTYETFFFINLMVTTHTYTHTN